MVMVMHIELLGRETRHGLDEVHETRHSWDTQDPCRPGQHLRHSNIQSKIVPLLSSLSPLDQSRASRPCCIAYLDAVQVLRHLL